MTPRQWMAHGANSLMQWIASSSDDEQQSTPGYPQQSTSGHLPIPTPWGNAPQTVLAMQLADKNRYNLNWAHEYSLRPSFSPGTGYNAYASFGLYEQTAIGGGVANRKQFRTVEHTSYMPIRSLTNAGIPHDAGQVALQPLTIDNPDLQGYIG